MCKYNIVGSYCQYCVLLYNDWLWEVVDGKMGVFNECRICKCNGYVDICYFDVNVWEVLGNCSGGVCDDCQYNIEGQYCQRCKLGFYCDLWRFFLVLDVCKLCFCYFVGLVVFFVNLVIFCDFSNGDCFCKFGVVG